MEKSTRKAKEEALVARDLFLIMARWPAERTVNVSGAQLTVTYRVLCQNLSLAAKQTSRPGYQFSKVCVCVGVAGVRRGSGSSGSSGSIAS